MELPKRQQPKTEEDFVTRASDEKGHHSSVTVAIPEQVAEIITQIVEKGYFPYRSKADLIRDALYHRLKWLIEKHELGYGALLRSERAIDHIVNTTAHSKEVQKRLEKLDEAMAERAAPPAIGIPPPTIPLAPSIPIDTSAICMDPPLPLL